MDCYPNEILKCILELISYEFVGYMRVSKRYYAIFLEIKVEILRSFTSKIPSPYIFGWKNPGAIIRDACQSNNKAMIYYVLEYGYTDYDFALHCAVHANRIELVELFLDRGAHVSIDLLNEIAMEDHIEIMKLFILRNPHLDLLMFALTAIEHGNLKFTKYMVSEMRIISDISWIVLLKCATGTRMSAPRAGCNKAVPYKNFNNLVIYEYLRDEKERRKAAQ